MKIAITSLLLVGCIAPSSSDDIGGDVGTGTGSGSGSGSGSIVETPAPVARGTYQVRSDIDLTVEAVLPETAANAVETLRSFEQNPARTLFDLAESAGVPAVGTVRDALPAYLEDKLEGWINGEIAKLTVDGVPVTQVAGSVVALAETALTQFALDSTLEIDGTTAVHTLKALDFAPAGLDARFDISSLPADIIAATATCTATRTTLSLGDHGYALAYGEYVWRALDASFVSSYGADIRGTLGAAVNCAAVANVVAGKCVWGVCVGHATELTQICERGLDEIVERAHAKVAAMRFDAIHLAAGTGSVHDVDADGTVDAIESGVWTAEINAGMGLRSVPATFTATR